MNFVLRIIFAVLTLMAQTTMLNAQNYADKSNIKSDVLVIDIEFVLRQSQLGQAIITQSLEKVETFRKNNKDLEEQLIVEENKLVDLRKTLDPEKFRILAEEFDERANSIRQERLSLDQSLVTERETQFRALLQDVSFVFERLLLKYDAKMILHKQNVFLSINTIDITQEALKIIDEEFPVKSSE